MNRREVFKSLGQCAMALSALAVGLKAFQAERVIEVSRDYESLRPPPPVITSIQTWIDNAPDWQGGDLYEQGGGQRLGRGMEIGQRQVAATASALSQQDTVESSLPHKQERDS